MTTASDSWCRKATVDRLLHHAHVCQTSGESVRQSQALAGNGVTALGGTR